MVVVTETVCVTRASPLSMAATDACVGTAAGATTREDFLPGMRTWREVRLISGGGPLGSKMLTPGLKVGLADVAGGAAGGVTVMAVKIKEVDEGTVGAGGALVAAGGVTTRVVVMLLVLVTDVVGSEDGMTVDAGGCAAEVETLGTGVRTREVGVDGEVGFCSPPRIFSASATSWHPTMMPL